MAIKMQLMAEIMTMCVVMCHLVVHMITGRVGQFVKDANTRYSEIILAQKTHT